MTSSNFRTPVAEHLLFKGRSGDTRLGELIRRGDGVALAPHGGGAVLLWGCPDDTGVVLNRGRAGAKDGPDAIRKHLYRMTPPMDVEWRGTLELYDHGNLVPCSDIVETQARCRDIVASLTRCRGTLIALGGGHDFAAPNFLGFIDGREASTPKKRGKSPKFSLINIDPHLDVRELENQQPHSGTPFRQILESGKLPGKRFVQFGTRPNRNAKHHYDYCRQNAVTVITLEELRAKRAAVRESFKNFLKKLAGQSDIVGVTIDMDTCAEADGVSAAPVIGFSTSELCEMAELAGRESKVQYLEIAEVAPNLDFNERSARIGAEIIYFFLRARLSQNRSRGLKGKDPFRREKSQ